MDSSVPHSLRCVCGEYESISFDNYQAAREVFGGLPQEELCAECGFVSAEPTVREPEAQMSNANAVDILDALEILANEDFSDRCVGSMKAAEMLERVLIAEAVAPEYSGLTTMQIENVIYCGRPADYIQRKLAQLREVAEWAIENGRDVTWA